MQGEPFGKENSNSQPSLSHQPTPSSLAEMWSILMCLVDFFLVSVTMSLYSSEFGYK